jgi:hypothetical protein
MTVDVNEFSMHHFYRNRLVRAYLGASNIPRRPNGFSGFDSRDDVALSRFAPSQTTLGMVPYLGPYPIFNAALNLTSGEDLAYQERQAMSFIFTPRFCGADYGATSHTDAAKARHAYRPTLQYAYPAPGIHLGSAMAISGAAISPNSGFHSSPAVAFLLTVFNVRLGWWLGNPKIARYWRQSSPLAGLAYLLKELSGSANDRSGYVYLSDGGHFENLGVYELVKRRCRFIVACDAEEDAKFGFEGLGNVIRKCRADLGVEIEIDVDQIRPAGEDRLSKWHCVVGKIHYEHRSCEVQPGILVYLKSSLTGDEPSDLLEYSLRQTEFPHQTTVDQFFDESQFESYRRLGFHAARSAFETALQDLQKDGGGGEWNPEDLFHMLAVRWYPPSPSNEKAFTRHTEQLNALQERLRTDPNLRFLHRQFYPEWKQLDKRGTLPGVREWLGGLEDKIAHWGEKPVDPLWVPKRPEQVRAGFFFCNLLIQLMENVYLDLNLDRYLDHPDNQGWMNLFRRWRYSGMFRVTWAISASTYGSRFILFCARELEMSIGEILVTNQELIEYTELERRRIGEVCAKYPDALAYQMQIRVKPDTASKATPLLLAFGTVVIHNETIVYLRVRRHLRRIGLARRALRAIFETRGMISGENPLTDTKPLGSIEDKNWERLQRLVQSTRPDDSFIGVRTSRTRRAEAP